MANDDREAGNNARPLNDTIAGTGPGIPDDALAPGQDLPEPPSEEEVGRIARKLGVDAPNSDGEAGQHGTRQQEAGEAGTTRFGMEEGDNTDVPATGLDPDRQSPPNE